MRDFFIGAGFFIALVLLMTILFTGVVQSVNYIDCKSFGRQTGRDVVYDWNCYARDDAGKMVPYEYAVKQQTLTIK